MTLGIGITVVGLLGTLYADSRESAALRWACKPLASLGFLTIAFFPLANGIRMNALHVGLVLSALGDVALVSRSRRLFLVGLVAFALAHIAYFTHFTSSFLPVSNPLTAAIGGAALVVFLAVGHRIWKWLEPHAGSMRAAVRTYVLIISLMATSAVAATIDLTGWELIAPVGAILLYLSDLAVARDRFVAHSFINKLWGLPLYYVGQVLIALVVSR